MGKALALAIKGHSTRGKEVIELLEMLGGSNKNNLSGNHSCAYYVNGHQNIIMGIDYIFGYEDMKFFTLEKFLEKYPYKVGDKVKVWASEDYLGGRRADPETSEIISMRWNSARCEIAYRLKDINGEFYKDVIACKVNDEEQQIDPTIDYEEIVNKSYEEECGKMSAEITMDSLYKCGIYPKDYEEDSYCETLEIKVLGYKVGDVVFANSAGWIRITNKLWDCYAKEHVYEGIGVLNEREYDNISHKNIITKMETDSVIENMKESITPSPHITANITEKNNCDIECPDMLDADKNLFHTTNEYEEIVDKSFQGGYEKCKLDIQLNGYELPDGYHFTDENGNVIDVTKILIKKNTPTYPKTYEACWKVFDLKHNLSLWWNAYDAHSGIVSKLPKELLGIKESIESLSKLLVCRNVYWKLYGEEIGLDGSWEPDWNDNNQPKFGIHNVQNDIRTINLRVLKNLILVFPTEEMRDAFYGNFKDLIETCKELL